MRITFATGSPATQAVDLLVLKQHMKLGGYMVDAGDTPAATLRSVIDQVMAIFP